MTAAVALQENKLAVQLSRALAAEQGFPLRPEQRPPDTDWRIFYLAGGRGSGKTHAGAAWLADAAWNDPDPGDWGIVAPTFADARDKCIEGESGLLRALGTNRAEVEAGRSIKVKQWNRSIGELVLRNGAVVHIDGADDGAPTVQGFNLRGLWATEVGLWRRVKVKRGSRAVPPWQMAWDESIAFAVRKGLARIFCDGTPKKGHPLVKRLMQGEADVVRVMRTADNLANLSRSFLDRVVAKYRGTRLEQQELEGRYLEDVEGALWKAEQIEQDRAAVPTRRIAREHDWEEVVNLDTVVVAVDPSDNESSDPERAAAGLGDESADEVGIMVCAKGPAPIGTDDVLPHGYLMADVSGHYSPVGWPAVVIDAYIDHDADYIVVERNNGGAMAKTLIQQEAERRGLRVRVELVNASRGKTTRAEPVAMLCDQHRIHHVGVFEELEDEQTSWVEGMASPNRMDGFVWGFSELLVGEQPSRLRHRAMQPETPSLVVASAAERGDSYRRRGTGRMRYVR
jgi:phage terminase large subunit-like protein